MSNNENGSNRLIKRVSVEYDDGSIKEVDEGFIILVTEDTASETWTVDLSIDSEMEKVLDFAYKTVSFIESSYIEDTLPTKKSHLTLVK